MVDSHWFSTIFASILKWFWLHFGVVLGAKTASKSRQNEPGTSPRRVQDRPRTSLAPKIDFRRILVDFWLIFGWFLIDFWLIFGWFLVDFWSIFCRCFIGLATLLLCYFVTLLLCYFVTLLLCSWRGGGIAALLRCGNSL